MMIQRTSVKSLKKTAGIFKVVAVTGPRQSGKTTLIKNLFRRHQYLNLENPDWLARVEENAGDFMREHSGRVIFDEVQKAPKLLSYVQVLADERQKKGDFILSGSENLLLSEKISQTLAGRAGYQTLLPLSVAELKHARKLREKFEEQIFYGFYPEIYKEKTAFKKDGVILYYNQYLATYLERDLRQIKSVANLGNFRKFMALLAGRVGQVVDKVSIANDTGVSSVTVEEWLSVLEASYLIVRLQPYFKNFGKRHIKSPKIYFTDTGLACRLLGLKSTQELTNHYLRGGLFENLVIMDIYKEILNRQLPAQLFYFRDSKGSEVDLLLDLGTGQIPVEIKSSSTYNADFKKGLVFWQNLKKSAADSDKDNSIIIYNGEEETVGGTKLLNWRNTDKLMDSITRRAR